MTLKTKMNVEDNSFLRHPGAVYEQNFASAQNVSLGWCMLLLSISAKEASRPEFVTLGLIVSLFF